VLISTLAGCQLIPLPGGELQGRVVRADDWSAAEGETILQLETRPGDPYSVNLRVTLIDGALYVDAAPGRRWHEHVREDPRVRVKLGDQIYRACAAKVEDEAVTKRFADARTVYRLVPGDCSAFKENAADI